MLAKPLCGVVKKQHKKGSLFLGCRRTTEPANMIFLQISQNEINQKGKNEKETGFVLFFYFLSKAGVFHVAALFSV